MICDPPVLQAVVSPSSCWDMPLMVNKPLWEKLSATADLELLEPPSYVGPQNGNNGVVVLRYQFKK